MVLIEIIILVISVVLFCAYSQWKHSYWKRRNVPSITPKLLLGNMENPFKRTCFYGVWLQNLYKTFREQGEEHAGFYMSTTPYYLAITPEMIKNIVSIDFDYFVDRGTYYNEKYDPLSANVFTLEGQRWKDMRKKLTPAFTSGKIKSMFDTIAECTKNMTSYLSVKYKNEEEIDIKKLLERFTIDVIGSCAFGIECNSFKSEEGDFQREGKKHFAQMTKLGAVKALFCAYKPELAKKLGIRVHDKNLTGFFLKIVKETVTYRQTQKVFRNDMLQILMEMHNKSDLTVTEVAAQAFVFFLGGYETSAGTMTFCLYELAVNEDIQNKVREEINSVLASHGNKITYDAIMDLKYMQQVVDETLRLYPLGFFIKRLCIKDYRIPNTNIILERGMDVMIPTIAFHRDPEYFPDPEKFDPDRFAEINKDKIVPFSYLPFGEGPRYCIGVKFAMLEMKIALTTLLKDYKFSLKKEMKRPLAFSPYSFMLTSEPPIMLNIEPV